MPPEGYLLYVLIVACEVGFWVVLLAVLATRYLLAKERLSRALLLCLPLVDVLLLAFTAMDLRHGSAGTFEHGLAAAYVGFTLAFGGMAVKWADAHFAHRFAAGAVPAKAPCGGWQAVRYDFNLWGRCIMHHGLFHHDDPGHHGNFGRRSQTCEQLGGCPSEWALIGQSMKLSPSLGVTCGFCPPILVRTASRSKYSTWALALALALALRSSAAAKRSICAHNTGSIRNAKDFLSGLAMAGASGQVSL